MNIKSQYFRRVLTSLKIMEISLNFVMGNLWSPWIINPVQQV